MNFGEYFIVLFIPYHSYKISNFLNFVACQRFTIDNFDEKKLMECMGQFMHSSVGSAQKSQYVQFFQLVNSISEPYVCDPEIAQIPKTLKEDYNTVLCFDSYGKQTTVVGVLLFKNEKLMPKLLKIKL